MSKEPSPKVTFVDFTMDSRLLDAVASLGFVEPTPIQTRTIPLLMSGCDLLGQAQTGTGKTAAFGLPLLGKVDTSLRSTQALVLAPTRELALQVSKALKEFSSGISGLRVVPIYGGQSYSIQLRALRKGAHVVVGTPGRTMDHMRRGTLKLDELKTLVLDEADEMLNMGFVEDIEWILGNCPEQRQTALFSATIPPRIRSIASKYMNNPELVLIEKRTSAARTIRQRYWLVGGLNKLDALSRILEAEPFDASLIFVRTKASTVTLAEQLIERGFKAAALHGDMPQNMREHTVGRVKNGQIDLLVATDVAARGLDIERFGHVINFDMPTDAEAYVHRIGRTGRAGREGQAISFVAHRQRHLLKAIERITKQRIHSMELPGTEQLNAARIDAFKKDLQRRCNEGHFESFVQILQELIDDQSLDPVKMAAALAMKAQGSVPLLLKDAPAAIGRTQSSKPRPRHGKDEMEPGMDRYWIAVGQEHDVQPGNIVGAIAGTAGLAGRHIGRITINQDHSLVDLPEGMPKSIFQLLKKTRVCEIPLDIRLVSDDAPRPEKRPRSFRPKSRKRKNTLGGKRRPFAKSVGRRRKAAGRR